MAKPAGDGFRYFPLPMDLETVAEICRQPGAPWPASSAPVMSPGDDTDLEANRQPATPTPAGGRAGESRKNAVLRVRERCMVPGRDARRYAIPPTRPFRRTAGIGRLFGRRGGSAAIPNTGARAVVKNCFQEEDFALSVV